MYVAGDLILCCEVYAHVVAPQVRTEVCDYCLLRRGILLSPEQQSPPEPLRRCSRCQVGGHSLQGSITREVRQL